MNLIKIAQRLQHHINSSDLNDIFEKFSKDDNISEILKKLDGEQIIKLCFLVWGVKNKMDPQEVSNLVDIELFAYSIVEFHEYDVQIDCDDCGGSGNVTCDYCDGRGSTDCETCDGDGEVELDSEEEYEMVTCSDCNGSGHESCDYCYGSGEVDCTNCYGGGSIDSDDHIEFDILNFVSINKDLKSKLELLNGATIAISDELFSKMVNNSLLFLKEPYSANDNMTETSRIDKKYKGDMYLNHFADVMDFQIKKYGKTIRIDDIEDLDRNFYK